MSDKGKADTNRCESATRKSSLEDSHVIMDETAPVLNTPECYSDLPDLISDSESSSCSTDGDTEESESENDG
jgi:hypothetical protein